LYIRGESDPEDHGSLEIGLDGGQRLTLSIALDGQSVCARQRLLARSSSPADDDKEWRLIDLSSSPPWSLLVGREVVEIDAMVDCWQYHRQYEWISGWRFSFNSGDCLIYFNDADRGKTLLNENPSPDSQLESRWVTVATKVSAV
jgi:hypothetical protein